MARIPDSTTATGRWVLSLKQWPCESCGDPIFPGERHLRFDWSPDRVHTIECSVCAQGVATRSEVTA